MRDVLIPVAALLLGACEARQPASDPNANERALLAANAEYDKALIDGDAAALDRFYTSDFTIIDDDAGMHAKTNQIAFMTKEVDLLEARSSDEKVTMFGADAALITGKFTGRYRYRGKEAAFTERYTSVWVRDDGRWRIRHEHASLLPDPKREDTR